MLAGIGLTIEKGNPFSIGLTEKFYHHELPELAGLLVEDLPLVQIVLVVVRI